MRIRETCSAGNLTYIEAERAVLETDHADVGAAVARHWEFPESLVSAIERHHDPDPAPEPLLDVVHVANAVAKLVGVGLGSEQMNMKASSQASRRLGLSAPALEALCADVAGGLAKAEEVWRSTSDGA